MVQIFKAKSKAKQPSKLLEIDVLRLDHQGVGVGKYQGKSVFVEGALPEETVQAQIIEQKSKFAKAKLKKVLKVSPQRQAAQCQHFALCGGCDLQHMNYQEQLHFKQQQVNELFQREQITESLPWQPPLIAEPWHYRRKVRIGVQYNKNDDPIIGFRRKGTNQLVTIKRCDILPRRLENLFAQLADVLARLTIKKAVGHIEVIVTEQVTLVVRQLKKLTAQDQQYWLDAAKQNNWQVIIDFGQDAAEQFIAITENSPLRYQVDDTIEIEFMPADFIQVNERINQQMVAQAIDWLALISTDVVLDLFCGLGNFSLPLAKRVAKVVGIEGVSAMVERARQNATTNQLNNCEFFYGDLNQPWCDSQQAWQQYPYNKVLLDPARAGALNAVSELANLAVDKVLYVSCDPHSLARDTKALLGLGFKISKIAVMDMFSQTKHIETMVLFVNERSH